MLALPRLSVDIDLNYIGALDVEEIKAEKSALEKLLRAICGRLGMNMQPGPPDHAGGKWNIQYRSSLITNDTQLASIIEHHPSLLWRASKAKQ